MASLDYEKVALQEEERLRKVHPTVNDVPGCMKLVDDLLSCNILLSQLNSLYRYGEMSKCSSKMEDFKFCMSQKSLDSEDRRELWIRRRAEWWARRRMTRSSEDVWEIRTEPPENLPPHNLDPLEGSMTVLS